MSKIADVYSREIMDQFREQHNVQVSGNVWWIWSCSCGKGSSTGTTQGRATAGRDRHLRAEHRRYIAKLEAEGLPPSKDEVK